METSEIDDKRLVCALSRDINLVLCFNTFMTNINKLTFINLFGKLGRFRL